MSIEKANEARRKLIESGEYKVLDPLEKTIADGSKNRRLAIDATCFECLGGTACPNWRKEVAMCSAWDCALWRLRPHQRLAPEGYGEEKRAAALSKRGQSDPAVLAERHPTSRAGAIKWRCQQCMGSRKYIPGCQAHFPRPGKEYQGCPLWPLRPGATADDSDTSTDETDDDFPIDE